MLCAQILPIMGGMLLRVAFVGAESAVSNLQQPGHAISTVIYQDGCIHDKHMLIARKQYTAGSSRTHKHALPDSFLCVCTQHRTSQQHRSADTRTLHDITLTPTAFKRFEHH
jgi:hypothetical protein